MSNKSTGSSAVSVAFFLKQLSRRSILVLAAVVALAAAVAVTTLRPPASAAVEQGGVTWNPGDVSWEILPDGRCITTLTATVTAKTNQDAKTLSATLQALPKKTDLPAESGITDAHANVGDPGNTTGFPVVAHAYLPKDKCEAAAAPGNQAAPGAPATPAAAGALYDEQGSKLDDVQLAAAALPKWLKGGVASVVGAGVYIAVSTIVGAIITFGGWLEGATAAVVAAVTAVAGCIGGAASTAVTLMMAGAGGDWKSNLTNAVSGCMTGAAVALLPIEALGAKIGNAVRGAFGMAPVLTVGEGAVAASVEAGLELNPITDVVHHTADTLVAVQ